MFARHWSERKKPERAASVGDYGEVVLNERLRSALARMTEAVHSVRQMAAPARADRVFEKNRRALEVHARARGVRWRSRRPAGSFTKRQHE